MNNLPDMETLTTIMRRAFEVGCQAARTTPDHGTCNFDTCILRGTPAQRGLLLEAARAAGFSPAEGRYYGALHVALLGIPWGQGNSRTAASEAVCRVLKEAGIAGTVHYQMD